MRRLLLVFVLAAALTTLGVGAATAAPSDVHLTVGPKAQFVSPASVLVPVTYTCPATYAGAFVSVQLSQSSTGATGSGFLPFPQPCTGQARTVVVIVSGGPFSLGQAIASGFAVAGNTTDSDVRRIQIVL